MSKAFVRYWNYATCTNDPILGQIANAIVTYFVSNDGSHEEHDIQVDILPADAEASIKVKVQNAVIADAATHGYTIIATDIVFPDCSRGIII